MRMNTFLPSALFVCAFTALVADAAPYVWVNNANGDASGSWAVPSSWGPPGIPGAADSADFSAHDITVDSIIDLGGNQAINAMIFGDLDPTTNSPIGGWTIGRLGLLASTLTLASPIPTITV